MTPDSQSSPLKIGLMLYPQLTQLDLTGPYEIFARLPGTRVLLAAATLEPVRSERGLAISPDVSFEHAPQFDIVFVPGGMGVSAMMEDDTLLGFLERQAPGATYVTSVCTGALILGAAGLLRGYRATTHWLYLDLLPLLARRSSKSAS